MPRKPAKKSALKPKTIRPNPLRGGEMIGEEKTISLEEVKPNGWNPNEMDVRELESLEYGLKTDGWVKSQKLLIWGTDEKGKVRNLIIDGEHRWKAAINVGFKEGPAVILHGLKESAAKALTVKLDKKRGSFNQDLLRQLVSEIQFELGDNPALDLGFADADYNALIATSSSDLDGIDNPPGQAQFEGVIPTMTTQVNMVQIFLTSDQKALWDERVRVLAGRYGTKNATDTVIEAIRVAAES